MGSDSARAHEVLPFEGDVYGSGKRRHAEGLSGFDTVQLVYN